MNRTILTCCNDDVDDLNAQILAMFPGEERVYHAVDQILTEGIADNIEPYPQEFLASIRASGLPLANLALKTGCPLILLQNLDPSAGLCNGTWLILVAMKPHVLQCCILSGDHAGDMVFIPRITLKPSNEDLPVPLERLQFPVHLGFAMTINKAQGQSVKKVGLDLRSPVFSHGQLYVALSHCTSGDHIKVIFPPTESGTKTLNIVYSEALAGIL